MTEIQEVNIETKQRFITDKTEYMNIISDMIENDVLRYDRNLDIKGNNNEYI